MVNGYTFSVTRRTSGGKGTEMKVKAAKMGWTGMFEASLAGLHRLARQRSISKED